MSVIERLGRNLQFSAYSRAITILSSLFLTPFILNHVDLGLYGLNILLVSIVGCFNMMDFGLSSGISRFTAVFFGTGKREEIVDILSFGIKFFLTLAILIATSLFTLSFFYEKLFHIDLELVAKGRVLLAIYAVSSLFMWVIMPFQEILNGFQRSDIISKIVLAISILNIPIALIVLTYSRSYLLYIGLLQLLTIILSLINVIAALKLVPDFRFKLSPIPRPLRKQLLKFSGWSFASGILGLIIFQIDNLVIGIFLGVNAVAIYFIAFAIHNYIRSFNSLVGSPLYHVITTEFAKRNKSDRDFMIINATRIHSGILIPIVIITLLSADNFIVAWVGERFSSSILPCKILLSYWFFNITKEILSQGVKGGEGKVVEAVKLEGFVAIANLGLSLLLIKFLGITGVALGTAIPWILASSFYLYRFCNILAIPVLKFIRQAVVPNLPHFLFALILSVIAQRFMKSGNVFWILAIMVIIYGITLVVGYSMLPVKNKHVVRRVMILRV